MNIDYGKSKDTQINTTQLYIDGKPIGEPNTINISTTGDNLFNVNWNNFMETIKNIKLPNFYSYYTDNNEEKEEGEDNMENKVLDIYFRRMREKINKEYDKKIINAYNELPVVKEYNDVIKEFEATLAEMADRYNTEETKFLIKSGYANNYAYELTSDVRKTLGDDLQDERKEKLKELELLKEEVEAQLSISNDKDYQLEVLKNYEIIDKKTNKITI